MKQAMTAQENYRRNQISRAMKRSSEMRKCPNCGRKGAIKTEIDGEFVLNYCRYDDCGYEKGRYA